MGGDTEGNVVTMALEPLGQARSTLQVQLGKAMQTVQVIWPAAPIMACLLLSEHGRLLTRGKVVIDRRWSWNTRPARLLLLSASSVVLTDHNPAVLDILRRNLNIALNAPTHRGTPPPPAAANAPPPLTAAVAGAAAMLRWTGPPRRHRPPSPATSLWPSGPTSCTRPGQPSPSSPLPLQSSPPRPAPPSS
jgi:hypothetical protein